MIEWKKKAYDTTVTRERNGVVWLEFRMLNQLKKQDKPYPLKHAYSTRIGGVSTGCYASMNLRGGAGDSPENYRENVRRFCEALQVPMDRIAASSQTHTVNVQVIHEEEAGYGRLFGRQFQDVDGLVTNVKNIPLVTSFADCIPLYIVDPVRDAIGLSHAGWRGTVGRIGAVTVETMRKEYGSLPADLYACIGPGICGDCYEIGEDVAQPFYQAFPADAELFLREKGGGKYLLDLWEANRTILLESGILPEHIAVTDICTRCNAAYLFSHRVQGNARGNQCAFLMLAETQANGGEENAEAAVG